MTREVDVAHYASGCGVVLMLIYSLFLDVLICCRFTSYTCHGGVYHRAVHTVHVTVSRRTGYPPTRIYALGTNGIHAHNKPVRWLTKF